MKPRSNGALGNQLEFVYEDPAQKEIMNSIGDMMKLSLLTFAALLTVAAQAHAQAAHDSRAICKEREKLAVDYQGKTNDRFHEGELTRTDVAQADLRVLTVQLGCNLIRTSTYVNEASIAAKIAYNGTVLESRVGQKTQADIDEAQKKVDFVSALDRGQAQCSARVAGLEAQLKKLNEQFKRGEVSRLETSDMSLNILDTRLKCGTVLIGTYCNSAPDFAKVYSAGVTEEARVGQRTELEVMNAQDREITVRSTCL